MAEIEKKPVKIVETILRDAHQSLIATRMTTEQMMPIVEKMDKVGYHAVECWGGATFESLPGSIAFSRMPNIAARASPVRVIVVPPIVNVRPFLKP